MAHRAKHVERARLMRAITGRRIRSDLTPIGQQRMQRAIIGLQRLTEAQRGTKPC